MKVLILGATGLLAKPTVEEFANKGYKLRLFSRNIRKEDYSGDIEVVSGDVFNPSDLKEAIIGCDAIHISLSRLDEALATEKIVALAKQNDIKLISYISGSTVDEKNSWFPMIANKLKAEKNIKESGIPYVIFRPTWFFESLSFMIRNNKPSMFGKQPMPYSWVTANDFAKMVVAAYEKEDAKNKTFYIHGPEKYQMKDVLLEYAKKLNPEVTKVSSVPIGLMKFIGFISGNKMLKMAASLFGYFEKTEEMGDPSEANKILGAPITTFSQWLANI